MLIYISAIAEAQKIICFLGDFFLLGWSWVFLNNRYRFHFLCVKSSQMQFLQKLFRKFQCDVNCCLNHRTFLWKRCVNFCVDEEKTSV